MFFSFLKQMFPKQIIKSYGNGLVLIKNAVPHKVQLNLAKYAISLKKHFYHDDGVTFNSTKSRGRIYDAMDQYPEPDLLKELCHSFTIIAKQYDIQIKE